jgi:putative peptidoglycan lipid II flippase
VLAIAAAFLLSRWYGADGHRGGNRAWRVEHGVQPDPPRRGDVRVFDRCRGATRLPRIALSALAMGVVLWLAARSLAGPSPRARTALVQAVLLLAVIAAGIAIYGLFLRLFGVIGWREAVNAVRQTRA